MLIGSTIASILLVAVSIVALRWHFTQWKRQNCEELLDEDRAFYYRQYRRRMQASSIFGICGIAIFVGTNLLKTSPRLFVFWWCGTLLLLLWAALLAAADIFAIQHHARRKLDNINLQQQVLRSKIRSLHGDNGGRADDGKRGMPAP